MTVPASIAIFPCCIPNWYGKMPMITSTSIHKVQVSMEKMYRFLPFSDSFNQLFTHCALPSLNDFKYDIISTT